MSSGVLKLRLEQSFKDEANLSIPNKQTIKAFKDVKNGKTVKVESFSGLIEEIDKELEEECSRSE